MKITVWGCRGTLPTPGSHTLKYGGNTTCLEIRNAEGFLTIVDAGSGLRYLGKKLIQENGLDEMCLMLTHSHWDHLMGFPFFVPAYFSRFRINVCGVQSARNYMAQSLARQLEAPYFPVNFEQLKANFNFSCKGPGCDSCVHLKVESISLSHPNGGFGFRFSENGRRFVFLTDNELGFQHPDGLKPQDYVEFSRDADLLFHDAQYTDEEYVKTRTWGHSTYNEVLDLAINANVKRLGLFHHDPDRTDAELDRIVSELQNKAAARSANLEIFAVSEGMQIKLE
ncbi:MAG: MBL fold metallo-hydrolase [Candidatus Riflebacteria bacterium]|nr:MBL fold metallo-hydrolase [Candidatus Riflebacteria bacterium]